MSTLCTQIALLGEPVDLTYKYEYLGPDPAALAQLLKGPFLEKFKAAKNPAVVVGPGVLKRADREIVMKTIHQLVEKAGMRTYAHTHTHTHTHTSQDTPRRLLCRAPVLASTHTVGRTVLAVRMRKCSEWLYACVILCVHTRLCMCIGVVKPGWNGYNVIHESASRVAALDLGIVPSEAARAAPPAKVVFLFGADDYPDAAVPKDATVVRDSLSLSLSHTHTHMYTHVYTRTDNMQTPC